MMNMLEEAIIYATIMYQGKRHMFENTPYILHPLAVTQILSTMTDDQEVLAAGILHDITVKTDGTFEEIEKRFGKRVASLVASKAKTASHKEESTAVWKRKREEVLHDLQVTEDIGLKQIWLADVLETGRSLVHMYGEQGEECWKKIDLPDPEMLHWYFTAIAETLELSLNRTGAFKELIMYINFFWPGTFPSEKARFRKYREVSVDGCELIGRGAKGDVYRYDDELIIKVYNQNNTYHDVEREIAQSRRAFVLGMPTAISFGIVSVGDRYGAMYELVNAETMSECIARAPQQVDYFGRVMADIAHSIHRITVSAEDEFPDVSERMSDYIDHGIAAEDEELAAWVRNLVEEILPANTLIHGDFHTGNVFLANSEPMLIDMDRVSHGHPIVEIADEYYFYVVLGENDPSVIENFMGFSYETAKRFFHAFLTNYLETEDEARLREIIDKASVLCCTRMLRKLRIETDPDEKTEALKQHYVRRLAELRERVSTLKF